MANMINFIVEIRKHLTMANIINFIVEIRKHLTVANIIDFITEIRTHLPILKKLLIIGSSAPSHFDLEQIFGILLKHLDK